MFPFDILASLNSGEPSPCTMSSSRKNNIQRWKLDWEIHSSKHFSKPTSLRAGSSISNPTEKSNYHNLFNHIRRWNIWSKTKVWKRVEDLPNFCGLLRDIQIECSKQFKWNLHFHQCGWTESAILGSTKTTLKFKYEIQIG